jgi:hypothetical protein
MLAGRPPFTGVTAQAIIAKRFVSGPKVRTTRDVPEAWMPWSRAPWLARQWTASPPRQFVQALRGLNRDGATGGFRH